MSLSECLFPIQYDYGIFTMSVPKRMQCNYTVNELNESWLNLNCPWPVFKTGGVIQSLKNQFIKNFLPFEMMMIQKIVHLSCLMTKATKWLCAQRILGSAWASTKSNQSLPCPHEESWVLSFPLKILIRLGGCPGWSESSLGALILLVLFVVAQFMEKCIWYNTHSREVKCYMKKLIFQTKKSSWIRNFSVDVCAKNCLFIHATVSTLQPFKHYYMKKKNSRFQCSLHLLTVM